MSDTKVSIIIPAYNAQSYIHSSLESALRQTYRDIEIIVVDDGSRDGTAAIVEEFIARDGRIRLLRQSNAGVAEARNRAIAAARGNFIAPLDADDVWDSTKIERQVRRMEIGGEQTGFVYCWWVLIDGLDNIMDSSPRWRLEGRIMEQLVEINFTGNASVPLFRKTCVEQVGGYNARLLKENAQGCEDWDLAIRVSAKYSIGVVPAYLTGYRRGSDSMSSGCRTMWKSHRVVVRDLSERRPDFRRDVLLRSRAQFALHLAGISFWSGSYFRAIFWVLKSRKFDLLLGILPYLPLIFMHRSKRAFKSSSKKKLDRCCFQDSTIPETLIPYDRIYKNRWSRGRDHLHK